MSPPRIWAVSEDGEYDYVSLSPKTLEGGLEVMRKSFFLHESVAVAVELHKYPEAIKELEELTLRAARDGVSLVTVERKTGKVVAAAFNKLQVPAMPGEDNYFEKYAANCKQPSAKSLVNFMIESDAECDLFKHCNVDCLLEIMFLATLPEYRGKGLAKRLCEISIVIAKQLASGVNVKQSLSGEKLPIEPVPQMVSAIYTSYITQKIGKALNFTKAVEIDFNRWSFDGKTFAERIGPKTPTTTLEYYRI
ncbi:PREDICTED: uncharacterized protein LOC108567150 [Nicrophorus vespilloides]|uniref:Uncharacterized protein LOC108567150 n=1 Tax=Nicrophorus vespilloides TaxID=110193 RepID=A0ABM1N7Y9_NICVS|nr:PREDICTED: uncharacterized protein LOC108567150 [Nicrophorus vespilloides]